MLRFGSVVLDVDRALLRDSNGAEVALRPKSLDLLLTLARNPGRVMSRDELFESVWPDVTVTDDNIGQCVHEVRRAIGDPEGRLLRTVVKRGYCLDIEGQSESVTAAEERPPAVLADRGRPSLVVLPFQSIPYDPDSEWFADGIVEEITTALSRFRSLFVIARNSAFTFKGQSVDVRDVGNRLGVRYVLEGSVRRAGGQLRVTGQLVEAETGSHVWADRYDGPLSDVFELQDRITAAVAGVLEPSIRRAEIKRAARKPTADLTAYELYLRAIPDVYALTKAGYEQAKSLLERAIARDPNFAQAPGTLAALLERGAHEGWESDFDATRNRAINLARRTRIQATPKFLPDVGGFSRPLVARMPRDLRSSIGQSLRTPTVPRPTFAARGYQFTVATSRLHSPGLRSASGLIRSLRGLVAWRFRRRHVSFWANMMLPSRRRNEPSVARRTPAARVPSSSHPSLMRVAKRRRGLKQLNSSGAIRDTRACYRAPTRFATRGWLSSFLRGIAGREFR
jgi:TolB-like protein